MTDKASVTSKLYTTKDLAARYAMMSSSGNGLTRQTLYRWRKERDFPEPRIKAPQLMWLRADVHQWELANNMEWMHDDDAPTTH